MRDVITHAHYETLPNIYYTHIQKHKTRHLQSIPQYPKNPHTTMSAKDCGHDHDNNKTLLRLILALAIGLIILILFLILLIWLILRPTKPRFTLQDATVYAFNLSSPATLTTSIQITLSARNPNARIGIYYDRLDVYATYHNQQITLATLLPPSYQGHKDVTVWSPFLYGNSVPVAPYVAGTINQEQMADTVLVNIRVNGRVRWKVGSFVSGRYHLHVNCPAYVNYGGRGRGNGGGVAVGPGVVKYQLILNCHVDV